MNDQLIFLGDEIEDDLSFRVRTAIERLKMFEPPEGYYLAFSGGKDSVTIYQLAKMAGVKFDSHYAVTTVDPPELTKFIKKFYPDVERSAPNTNMWDLIVEKRMPPTRIVRYCCDKLKEEGGQGRTVITGVRWAESAARKNSRKDVEFDSYGSEKKTIREAREKFYLLNDNDKARRLVEHCPTGRKGKHVLNPIIDWTEDHVWEFHRRYGLDYCHLYDEGLKRLGCIACPMAGERGMIRDFLQWPFAFKQYLVAFDKMNDKRIADGLKTDWKGGHDVMRWWLKLTDLEYEVFMSQMKTAFIKDAKPHWIHYTDINQPIN